jgi:hypothetical protein
MEVPLRQSLALALSPLAVTAAIAAPAHAQTSGPASAPAPGAKKTADQSEEVHWNEIVAGSSRIKFYGTLRLDAYYDDSRPNNTQIIGWVRSEDPTAPATIGAPKNAEDFTMHPRLTRFGFDVDGPVIESMLDAKVTGKLEVDFYNVGLLGQTESRQALRLRHGYLKLAWGDLSVLAGQTADLISPIFPIVNPDLVMWGAGNLGDRRPQFRPEFTPKVGDGRLMFQAMVGLTGATDATDLDPAGAIGSGYRDGETSGLPTFQGRIAYKVPVGEKKQNLEVGVWGHRAWEDPDIIIAGKTHFDSSAYGVDLTVPIWEDLLWVKSELWRGENVDDVRGGIFQGINTLNGREIGSRGGFVEAGVRPHKIISVYAGWSTDDPENDDLPVQGRSLNEIWYGALRFNFDPVEIGFDYLHWKTEFIGFGPGDDNRYSMFVAYKF